MGALPVLGKWIAVPAAFAFLGYSCIGPRLAGKPAQAIQEAIHKVKRAPTEVASSPETDVAGPKVTVGVHPIDETTSPEETPQPRRRRRRHRREADSGDRTPDPASTPDAPPAKGDPDPASTVGP